MKKNALINVTRNVLDEKTSKEVGKKIVITTVIADAAIVGLYGLYLRWSKKQQEKSENETTE